MVGKRDQGIATALFSEPMAFVDGVVYASAWLADQCGHERLPLRQYRRRAESA
jgi:hypothetical protein